MRYPNAQIMSVMFRKLIVALSFGALAACTTVQNVDTRVSGEGATGQSVRFERDGLSEDQIERALALLKDRGYRGDGANAEHLARIRFELGEAVRSEREIDLPEYEPVEEIIFVNGRAQRFIDHRYVGYSTHRLVDTDYPAEARLEIRDLADEGKWTTLKRVNTSGPCGDAGVLRPVLVDLLLDQSASRRTQVELPDC